MALPIPPNSINLDDVNLEISTRSSGDQVSLNDSDLRGLTPNSTYADAYHGAGINTTSGSIISMYELHGASAGNKYTALSGSPSPVNEGSSVSFTVTTSAVPNGTTVGYTVTGISSADLSSGSLTGSITINSNTGSVTFGIAADSVTEGTETLTLTLASTDSAGNSTASLSASVNINDTSTYPALSLSISGTLTGNVQACYGATATTNAASTATANASGGSGSYSYYWEVAGGAWSQSGVIATAANFTNGRYASSNGAYVTGYPNPSSSSSGSATATIRVTLTDTVTGNTTTATTSASYSWSWHPASGTVLTGYYCGGGTGYDYGYDVATNDCGGVGFVNTQTCSTSCYSSLSANIYSQFNGSVSGSVGSTITASSGTVYAYPSGGTGNYTYNWNLVSYNIPPGLNNVSAAFGGTGSSQGAIGSVTATASSAGTYTATVVVECVITSSCNGTVIGTVSPQTTGTFTFTFS